MASKHSIKSAITFTIGGVLALLAISLPAMTPPSMANPSESSSLRQGLPGRRISGGSRSPDTACLATPDQPVIALVPKNNVSETLSERPTFWVFVPAVNQDRTLEFGLFDAEGTLIHQESIKPSGQSELVSLSLPESVSPLRVDQNYRWYFSVVCNAQSRAEDLSVTSWVRRVDINSELTEQLFTSSPQEQIAFYQSSELWYDAFSTLASIDPSKTTQPSSHSLSQEWISQQWSSLLTATELTHLIPFSFVHLSADNTIDAG